MSSSGSPDRASIAPPFSQANPGQGTTVRATLSSEEGSRQEEADLLAVLASVLEPRGVKFVRVQNGLALENGLLLRPQFVQVHPGDDAGVCTTSTIEVNHPLLCAAGTFEYQHAIGSTLRDALEQGFVGWADTDLPVFMDALRVKLEECTGLELEEGEGAGTTSTPRKRQIILGPPLHAVARAASEPDPEHEFCPCCLLTNCLEAFQEPIEGDDFCGLRLFASRDANGVAQADCRINGVDWPAGVTALLKYVATWPERGFEYRKQFVAIRTLPVG
jgi:hypothetical protein